MICEIEYPARKGLYTCSMACRNALTRQKRMARYEDRSCAICGTMFNVAKLIRGGTPNPAKLCGMICVGENNRRLKLGSEIVEYEDIPCRNAKCATVIHRRVSNVKKEFCSRQCAFTAKRERILRAPRAHKFIVTLCTGQQLQVRSKWEAVFLKQFIEHNKLKWSYESKTIILEDGKTRYTPDFYLEDDDVFIEIKGWRDSNAWKVKAARKMGFSVLLLNRKILQNVYGLDMREKNLNSVCQKA